MSDRYKKLTGFILFACLTLIWQGCNIINPVEPIPTYIHIDSFKFQSNPALVGLNLPTTHSISNVWVYYNNNPIGEFDLPCTIPIITNGTEQVELFPGVIVNGLNSLTGIYPFYTADTFTLVPQPGKTINVAPVTMYNTAVDYDQGNQWISNFLGITKFNWVEGSSPTIPMLAIPPIPANDSLVVGDGSYSGSVVFTVAGDSAIYESSDTFIIASTVQDAYVEFDYKSSLPFYVGLSSNLNATLGSSAYYLGGFYPSDTWQHVYLTVDGFVSQYPGSSYNFFVKTSMPSGQFYGRLLLAHIHLLTD